MLIHHIVIFYQALANSKVVFFYFLLCFLYGFCDHTCLDWFTFRYFECLHYRCNALTTEEAHEIIFKREKELRRTGIALTACTTSQLSIDTAGIMSFRTNDCQTTCGFHFIIKLNVGTTTGHICSNRDFSFSSCFGNDFCFMLMLFRIQYAMLDIESFEHFRKNFRHFNAGCSNKYCSAFCHKLLYFIGNCIELFFFRLENQIIKIFADDCTIGWNDHNIEIVDFVEFTCFRFRSTGHAGEFAI